MNLAMMPAAQRHPELIAGLTAERAALSKAQMVGIRGRRRKSGKLAWQHI